MQKITLRVCYITKSFILNITSGPTASNPGTLEGCEVTSGSGLANFLLSANTGTILGTQSSTIFEVLYYATQAEAISGNGSNIIGFHNSGNATIYVRVQLISDPSCFNASVSFNLVVNPKPVVIDLPDQYVCINYALPSLTLGNYYSGINGTGLQLNANDIISTDQTIYIYYKNLVTGCDTETNFMVTIVEIQDLTPANTVACDSYSIPSYPYPGTRYFRQDGGPIAGNIELFPGNTLNTLGLNTIYVYFQSPTDLTCIIFSSYTVTISKTPTITGTFPNLFDCISITTLQPISTDIGIANYYTIDNTGAYIPVILPITSDTVLYLFSENNTCRTPILSFTAVIGTSSFLDTFDSCEPYNLLAPTVGEYRTEPNGLGALIQLGLITQTTTIYQYIPGAACTDTYSFTIRILKPALTDPVPVTRCESYTLPVNTEGASYYTLNGGPNNASNVQLFGGVDSITTTTTIYVFKPSASSITCYNEKPWTITINQKPILDPVATRYIDCYSFTLAPLSVGNYFNSPGGVNPITLPYTIDNTNTINNIKTVYIYAVNTNDPTCFSETSFIVDLDGVAIPSTFKGDKIACESYTLPVLPPNVFYYTQPHNPDGTGGGSMIPALTQYTNSTTTPIYIYTQTNVRRICADESSFTITIVKRPIANPFPTEIQKCDTFGLNDGIFEFDLTDSAIKTNILNGQTPDADFTLAFFITEVAANDSTATPINLPNKYQNTIPFTDSVWVRLTNNTIANPCFDVVELKLNVNLLPNVQLAPEYFICSDYEKGTILNPATLDTGLTSANYNFAWTLNGVATGGNIATLIVTEIGTYEVTVTDKTAFLCEKIMSTVVKLYTPYITIEYSDAFEDPTYITINVLGAGSENYEYQLDDSNFQDSPIFYNVSAGEHLATVRDKNGLCSPAPSKVFIINYPKFFTPNGDGFHEKWNLESLKTTNPDASISIFDRFGKLIKQITPSTDGWDGKFNEQPLPATDYWFTVDFTEKGSAKTFKSHFSLKR
ncbi:T9SS type B sorting domain-containing protein [Flavobacterium sp.]|uniref:T9SS type B sorting domain-containing protein n=1 Tax=Flavobacterium sp. TaxID=239 RepID=UPI00286E6289|nr:T9SS type B sorting domain-containing protein [Flavobacterium sp.]